MLPAAPFLPQASCARLLSRPARSQAFGALLGPSLATLLVCALTAPAAAQDLSARPVEDQPIAGAPPAPPAPTNGETPVAFAADAVEYDQTGDMVTASGNVVLRHENDSVRADTVTWNRKTGLVVATGNVRVVDRDGNQAYTDRVELTDELKSGAMENLLVVMREGGRLAAEKGQRDDAGNMVLTHAAYTGCAVETSKGCPRNPTWRILADRLTYTEANKRLRFENARIELFGAIQLPLFGLAMASDGRAQSGLLVPDFRFSRSNGIEVSDGWYWRIADNRDLTTTAYVFTGAAPMVSAEYRALTERGAYQITGYATSSNRTTIATSSPSSQDTFRGYIFANGRLQLDPNWSVSFALRRATDRTFLRRYDISRDDRLRSMVNVERIDADSYFSFAGYATQTMQAGTDQGMIPVALPAIDYRRRFSDPLLGGKIEAQVNTLAISRTDGQDTQRAFAGVEWSLRKLTGLGQLVTFTALGRADVYHSDENADTVTALYAGNPGWETRGVASAAVDVEWPLVGAAFGGTQVLTPHIQLVALPKIKNLSVPNEDARSIELETGNLFALNRFPGYDRIEDGVRFTYGVHWQLDVPRWRINTVVGQSVRLSSRPTLLPDGTGLSSKVSDIVGRTEVRYRDFVSLVQRFRLDKDTLAVRRMEFNATVGSRKTYAEIGYTKLNRGITSGIEDLRDREEVQAAGRVTFANYWSLFGSTTVNLTDRNEDPTYGSDGFQPLRSRLGLAYEDDCLEVSLTWRRDYQTNGDAKRGDSFLVRFNFKNLGTR
ncbi:LPS-assembly protein LptD [Novosphingobium colocasiae]|uniref:LPS-assembly protein LptD n=1 Tax=Novosphingobium colocasiae TaxID=1256513 RepID=UPI0035B4A9DA